jgi:hypothetical protein
VLLRCNPEENGSIDGCHGEYRQTGALNNRESNPIFFTAGKYKIDHFSF